MVKKKRDRTVKKHFVNQSNRRIISLCGYATEENGGDFADTLEAITCGRCLRLMANKTLHGYKTASEVRNKTSGTPDEKGVTWEETNDLETQKRRLDAAHRFQQEHGE